jgi:serine phosphatase RsbU (regulator of sigma subunit)
VAGGYERTEGDQDQEGWRDPGVGILAGVAAVVLLTILSYTLPGPDRPNVEAALLLSLTATAVTGWVWGRIAAVVTLSVAMLFFIAIHAFNSHGLPTARLSVGTGLLVLTSGVVAYALDRERSARLAAERRIAPLARERDRLLRLQQQAEVEIRRAEEATREQSRVLLLLQKETLTASTPRVPGLSFALAYVPASSAALVGGDFYNIYRLSDRRVAVILGDVTGKGAPAAAAGVMVSSMLRALFAESQSPANVVQRLNAALVDAPDFPLLATLFAAVVDGETGTVTYANAAQEYPCVVSAWGKVTRLEEASAAVGAFSDTRYREVTLSLAPGDTLVAFTDGLTEIRDHGNRWVDPGLVYTQLADLGGSPPQEVVNKVLAWARSIAAQGALRDDAALLAIRFEGRAAAEPRGGAALSVPGEA